MNNDGNNDLNTNESNSNKPNIEISIVGNQTRKGVLPHTDYEIKVAMGESEWSVFRRYSDFVYIKDWVIKQCGIGLPYFPEKTAAKRYSKKVKEYRSEKFQQMLNDLAKNEQVNQSDEWKFFIGAIRPPKINLPPGPIASEEQKQKAKLYERFRDPRLFKVYTKMPPEYNSYEKSGNNGGLLSGMGMGMGMGMSGGSQQGARPPQRQPQPPPQQQQQPNRQSQPPSQQQPSSHTSVTAQGNATVDQALNSDNPVDRLRGNQALAQQDPFATLGNVGDMINSAYQIRDEAIRQQAEEQSSQGQFVPTNNSGHPGNPSASQQPPPSSQPPPQQSSQHYQQKQQQPQQSQPPPQQQPPSYPQQQASQQQPSSHTSVTAQGNATVGQALNSDNPVDRLRGNQALAQQNPFATLGNVGDMINSAYQIRDEAIRQQAEEQSSQGQFVAEDGSQVQQQSVSIPEDFPDYYVAAFRPTPQKIFGAQAYYREYHPLYVPLDESVMVEPYRQTQIFGNVAHSKLQTKIPLYKYDGSHGRLFVEAWRKSKLMGMDSFRKLGFVELPMNTIANYSHLLDQVDQDAMAPIPQENNQ